MSFFHYVTYKYIIIKDKKLGIAYYVLASLILFYTIVQIFINKAYMQFDHSPRGNIRLLVNTPPSVNINADQLVSPYCCLNDTTCEQCRFLDGLSLNWPVESKAVTISTFVKERYEKQNLKDRLTVKNGATFKVVRESDYYSLNPEESLIKVEHSIMSSSTNLSASHRMMTGGLYDVEGNIIKILNSSERSRVDKLLLKDILQAANISLDDTSDAMNSNGRSYRKNGVVLQVLIDYRNAETFTVGTNKMSYSYHVRHIPYSDYRVKQEIPIPDQEGNINQRVVLKRYTTRIEFSQIGKIGRFSLSSLLLQLASLMGLLTLTATIIDTIALYVIPNKEMYRQYVFDSSPELRKRLESEKEDEKTKSKVE